MMAKAKTISPASVKRYAEAHGVEFDWSFESHTYSLECWAPEGKIFSATGTHFYALYGDGFCTKPDWSKTLTDLEDTVKFGFENCDDEECEDCK